MSQYPAHTLHGFPRSTLFAAGAAVLLSITAAAVGRVAGIADDTPHSTPVLSRQLYFRDEPNGAVAVADAADPGKTIAIMPPETNGFLRATVRGLASQRKRQSAGDATPFRLTEWADGRLTLEDPVIGRKVEMEAFGISNETVFAQLLTATGPAK